MKKLHPLLYVLFLIYWGCEGYYGEYSEKPKVTEVRLWGEDYLIESTFKLDLSNSGLTGFIPPEIGNLTNLTDLRLGVNELTGSIPTEIGNLTKLTKLILYNNEFTGEIPSEIGNLTNLTNLRLEYNQLTGSIPSEMGNLINLEYFRLDHNDFTGLLPENLCDLNESVFRGSIYGLTSYLTFSYNRLCPPYPSCLRGTYTDGYSGNQIPIIGNQDTSNCGD